MAASQHPWNTGYAQALEEGGAHFGYYKNAPDASKRAYCLVDGLSFRPAGANYVWHPGDEVQDVLPADVLDASIANGEVTYDRARALEAAKLYQLSRELMADEFQRIRAAHLRGEPLPE
jgi:hypothetical protein